DICANCSAITSLDRDWDVLSAPGTSSNNSSMQCSGKPLDAAFFFFGIITTVGTVIEGAAGQASRRWKGRDGWPTGPAVIRDYHIASYWPPAAAACMRTPYVCERGLSLGQDSGHPGSFHAILAAINKCLAQNNKSRAGRRLLRRTKIAARAGMGMRGHNRCVPAAPTSFIMLTKTS